MVVAVEGVTIQGDSPDAGIVFKAAQGLQGVMVKDRRDNQVIFQKDDRAVLPAQAAAVIEVLQQS